MTWIFLLINSVLYIDVMGEVHYFSLLGYVTNYVSQNLLEL